MKSLCLFVCYTESDHTADLPYIEELQRHFNRVIVVTNVVPSNNQFKYIILPNMRYDFGFIYRALASIDLSECNFMGIVNNSNLLLKNKNLDGFFAWCKSHTANFCGMTDSHEAPPKVKPKEAYHIQSHFLIFKNEAAPLLKVFFKEVKFEKFFRIKEYEKLRRAIIKECEVGLTRFMIKKGQHPASWFRAEEMNPKNNYSIQTNIHAILWEELIKEGYPLLKKKMLSGEWDDVVPNLGNKQLYL